MKLFLFPDKECELLALHSDDMRTKIDELRREHADDFFLVDLGNSRETVLFQCQNIFSALDKAENASERQTRMKALRESLLNEEFRSGRPILHICHKR